ncbi:MAG: Ig-like domain-containing protein [Lachnospiraceae bacterium]|nr:Ig-like domain-containing protein [Lachnospiraceae bacterium]
MRKMKVRKMLCAVMTAALLAGEMASPLNVFAAEETASEEADLEEAEESPDEEYSGEEYEDSCEADDAEEEEASENDAEEAEEAGEAEEEETEEPEEKDTQKEESESEESEDASEEEEEKLIGNDSSDGNTLLGEAFLYDPDEEIEVVAASEGCIDIPVTVTFDQEGARSMLAMINEYRTSGTAWYWNSDNSTKKENLQLSALTYDYELEKAAMQRAAELIFSFDHERPNGTMCYTASSYVSGENIAIGYNSYTTAAQVYDGWLETNENYSGQGHRRNMLSSGLKTIGIAHVKYKGYEYWVQDFGYDNSGAAKTDVGTSGTQVVVEISKNLDTIRSLTGPTAEVADGTEISAKAGETADLPAFNGKLTIENAFGKNMDIQFPVTDVSWTVTDTSVAAVIDGKLKFLKSGSTTASCKVNFNGTSKNFSYPVKVEGGGEEEVLPDTEAVDIDVVYDQTEAEKLLAAINLRRSDAGAEALTIDYGLTEKAMIRAAELGINASTTRPDGRNYTTVFSGLEGSFKECFVSSDSSCNTAGGAVVALSSKSSAVLLDTDMKYAGFSYGIYDGKYIWVAEFSDTKSGTTAKPSKDGAQIVPVAVLKSDITKKEVAVDPANGSTLNLVPGVAADLPSVTAQVTVKGSAKKAHLDAFSWTLSDTSLADISAGKITAKKTGSARLTADVVYNGKTTKLSYDISSKVLPQSITLKKDKLSIQKGSKKQISFTVSPEGADDSVSYNSSNTKIATVSTTGLVTAVAEGKCKITVSSTCSNVEAVCEVEVTKASETSDMTITVKYGQTEARKGVASINSIRKAAGKTEIQADGGLEKIAKFRAAEIAVRYSAEYRPDGSSWDTAYKVVLDKEIKTRKELIAKGVKTAEEAVNSWKTSAALTDSDYIRGALGHVVFNGTDYWVLELAGAQLGGMDEKADDSERDVTISCLTEKITSVTIRSDKDVKKMISCNNGDKLTLPVFTATVKYNGHEPNDKEFPVKVDLKENVTWSLADPEFGAINSDKTKLTVAKEEDTVLTATVSIGGTVKEFAYNIHVRVHVKSVELDKSSANLEKNETLQLGWKVLPENADNKNVSFESEDTYVATVSKTGLVKAVGAGSTKVIVRSEDNKEAYAACIINVDYINSLEAPVITADGDALDKNGRIFIKCNTPDAEIRYTLDGSYPDKEHGKIYTAPFGIDKDLTVKAVAYKLDGDKRMESPEASRSFSFIAEDWGDVRVEDRDSYGYASPEELPEGIWISSVDVKTPVYNGKAQKPAGYVVYCHSTMLKLKTDYSLSYKNNKNASKNAEAVFKFKGNYTGQKTVYFEIAQADLGSAVIAPVNLKDKGAVQSAKPVVKVDGRTLKNGTDYSMDSAATQSAPGRYTVNISGIGSYKGSNSFSFTILAADRPDLSKAKVSIPAQPYMGAGYYKTIAQLKDKNGSVPQVKAGSTVLTDADFDSRIINGDSAGKAVLVLSAKDGHSVGEKHISFNIKGTEVKKGLVIDQIADQAYTGSQIRPDVTVRYNGTVLKEGTDYTLEYGANIKTGKGKVTITGIAASGFSGKVTKTFKINKTSIAGGTVEYAVKTVYAKGGATPAVTLTVGGRKLIQGTDFTVKYSNNKAPFSLPAGRSFGEFSKAPKITIRGKGGYTGKIDGLCFEIEKQALSNVTGYAPDVVYSGKANVYKSKPVLTDLNGKKLSAGSDYEKDYSIAYSATVLVKQSDKPSELIRTAGMTVRPTDIIPAGTVLMIELSATEKSSYSGSTKVYFTVGAQDISKASAAVSDRVYSGSVICPSNEDISLTIGGVKVPDEGFEITGYINNVKAGTAKVTVRGKGNYCGVKTISFKIAKRPAV